jgi:hypothetical protein
MSLLKVEEAIAPSHLNNRNAIGKEDSIVVKQTHTHQQPYNCFWSVLICPKIMSEEPSIMHFYTS